MKTLKPTQNAIIILTSIITFSSLANNNEDFPFGRGESGQQIYSFTGAANQYCAVGSSQTKAIQRARKDAAELCGGSIKVNEVQSPEITFDSQGTCWAGTPQSTSAKIFFTCLE